MTQPASPAPTQTAAAPRQDAGEVAPDVKHQASPWPLSHKLRRVAWMFVATFLFRPSFHNWYGWRRLLLRAMGAKVGRGARVRPSVRIEVPWHLHLGDDCLVGDYAILYSLGQIRIGRRATVSQYAHLCAGTHDYADPTFPLLTPPVTVEEGAWVAADAFVGPGVTVGAWAVVGARSTVLKDVPPWQVWAGSPAKFVKRREMRS